MTQLSHSPAHARLFAVAALGLAVILSAHDRQIAAASRSDAPLTKTKDGRPDFQGTWNNATQTPLQRPAALGLKQFYTEQERAQLRTANHDEEPAQDDPGTYNQFWWEQGEFLSQTSLIVDPPDGRIPPLTAEGERRRAARQARDPERFDGVEDLNLAERCITRGAPKLPGGYNNNVLIVQTPEYIVMMHEMIHESRIIPLDGRPHLPSSIRGYLGDSRGRWEGDTLVVETTNFNDKIDQTSYNCCGGATAQLKIVERLRLADANTIDYRYTVDDPSTFSRPWTVSVPMRRVPGPVYEYACHEANYSVEGILRGARARDRE